MLDALLILFGLFALFKGEFQITHSRKVRGDISRKLGVFMLASVALTYFLAFTQGLDLSWIMLAALIITIVVSFTTAKQDEVNK